MKIPVIEFQVRRYKISKRFLSNNGKVYLLKRFQKICLFMFYIDVRNSVRDFLFVFCMMLASNIKELPVATALAIYVERGQILSRLETVQDFLIKLGIKPLMHLLEISIFSLDNNIVRLTKL